MVKVPAAYAWLLSIPRDSRPRMVNCALDLYGIHEGVGDADNPEILAWAREVGLSATYLHDSIAWCGLFMALVARRAGHPDLVPENPLWALNWRASGVPSPGPAGLGDILVFKRPGGGHVGLYVGEDEGEPEVGGAIPCYHVLGGNESDQVNIVRVDKARLVAARRPRYRVQPAGVRPYHLERTGGVVSTNEA